MLKAVPPGAGPRIDGFVGTRLRIDGIVVAGGALLTPDTSRDWDGNLDALLALDVSPEFILYGSGARLERPPVDVVQRIEAQGVGVEVMDTRAAARAWNLLRAEGRWIVAALRAL